MYNTTQFRLFLFLLLFAAGVESFAFNLILTKTDETCTGNGALQFSPQNPAAGATYTYRIFKHPDLTNQIAVVTTNTFGGLQFGTYRVIAEQNLGGVITTEFRDIEILSLIVPMTYSATGVNAFCGPDGEISIAITAGAASLYELMSGPVIRPPQVSPIFDNVPAGVYQIRVFDTCGEGFVQNFTLLSDSATLSLGPGTLPLAELPSCNTITVANSITPSPNDAIPYPLQAEFTVYPPGGGTPTVVNTTIPSGGPTTADAIAVIPFYYDQPYVYTIKVTDPCGAVYELNNNVVDAKFNTSIGPVTAPCQTFYLAISNYNFVPPLTITFTDWPAGFVPADFNPLHPTFSDAAVMYGGDTQPVPFGHYAISVTDSCGRTATADYTVSPPTIPPDVIIDLTGYPGCQDFGVAEISIAGFTIVTATLTVVPAAYPGTPNVDVSGSITDGEVRLDPLPSGDYVIVLTDDCGNTYTEPFTIPPGGGGTIITSSWPGCAVGMGSIRLVGPGSTLQQVTVAASPAGSGLTVGSDVSNQIDSGSGAFYMADLPPGVYQFDILDSCNNFHDNVSVNVIGYQVSVNTHEVTPHCGSFDLTLNHTANGISHIYWLQRLDTATGIWGHPQTGAPYPEGTNPTNINSYALNNNATNLNIGYLGTFRILKRFQSFKNGSDGGGFRDCIEDLGQFDFQDGFNITRIERLTCDGQFSDIAIYTNGVPPLTYKIKSKDGDTSFMIDNGTNHIFTQLESATYEFEVKHACGHIRNIIVNIGQLPSVAETPDPSTLPPIVECDDSGNDGQATFDLSENTALILGSYIPSNYTMTYHLSEADAEAGTNAIASTYTTGNTVIYVRLKHNASSCYDVTWFNLQVNPYPYIDFDIRYPVCNGQSITVSAPPGMLSYDWSDGQTGPNAVFSQPGNYILTVSNGFCTADYPFEIAPSAPPVIQNIETSDWTDNQNTITVVLNGPIGDYSYSIDGFNYQDSNVFTGLFAGEYTVYVNSEACGMTQQEVYLLMYPKFFTPNGDGYNDYWRVKFAEKEPNLKTFIFDRYGKLITGFMPDSIGWDGMLNGRMLPSTDYWFVVVRENGKEYRGHFSMKR